MIICARNLVIAISALMFLTLYMGSGYTASGASVSDSKLKVQTIAKGLSSPTSMAFIDNEYVLVLEKDTGRVRLILNGTLQQDPVLTVSVNTENERGLLGVATYKPLNSAKTFVFLYYTEQHGSQEIRNRLYPNT